MNNDINLNDVAMVVNIIDICSQRGAFKGNELAVIGQLREKFAQAVEANKEEAPNVENFSEADETSVEK